jgi:NAD(P)-dependent dehydrogenase (short-subunit alcohol dehydrogenase family)
VSVAAITGTSGGIGSALCQAFSQAGYEVIAIDRDVPTNGAHNLAIDLEAFAMSDTYRAQAVARIRSVLAGKHLDVLINNAAYQAVRPLEHLDAAIIRRTFAVNVEAALLMTQALLDALVAARGLVLNIGSVHATLTKPGFAAYATSKAAVHGMTRALAVVLGGRVRVNAIAPAAIETPMLRDGFAGAPELLASLAQHHPAGVIGAPEQVARLALFLASERSAYVTGAVIPLDGAIGSRLHDPA